MEKGERPEKEGRLEKADLAKRLYEVEIAGLPLKLRSSHDQGTVDALVSLLNGKIQETLEKHQGISFQNAILLAALHVGEELILTRRIAATELTYLQNQAELILSDLEASPLSHMRLNN